MAEAIIIHPEGIVMRVPFDTENSLEFLQQAVGGFVEHLPFPIEGVDAWVNEEGKIFGLEPNPVATSEMRNAGLLFPGDYIAGVMVLTGHDGEGATLGLTEAQLVAAGF
jgi:hypothetical protein